MNLSTFKHERTQVIFCKCTLLKQTKHLNESTLNAKLRYKDHPRTICYQRFWF